MPELVQVIINTAMQAERQPDLKAEPYHPGKERQGITNGYQLKRVHTRESSITFSIAQVCEGGDVRLPRAAGTGV